MTPAFFGIKRAHLMIVAGTRHMLWVSGMTPARYDLMRVVKANPYGITQRTLRYLLGVSAATISRMVSSLEALGYLRRSRLARDRRCVEVSLTEEGDDRIQQANARAIETRSADRLTARSVTRDRFANPDRASVRKKVQAFEEILRGVRRFFDDPSPFRHPWRGGPFVSSEDLTLLDGWQSAA